MVGYLTKTTNKQKRVHTGTLKSKQLKTNEGCSIVFNIIFDNAIKELKGCVTLMDVGYRNIKLITLSKNALADNLVLYTKSEKDLEHFGTQLSKIET